MASPQLVAFREFSPAEHDTWSKLYSRQKINRAQQIVPLFSRGIDLLGFTEDRIPDLNEVNKKLKVISGFEGVPVKGFEEPHSFYEMLARRQFPIGYFIRNPQDLGYTPEPDIFHDLYGHLPFLVDSQYADFCQELGKRAIKFSSHAQVFRQWERLFWFGVEFPLVKNELGIQIFGAGIASSFNECAYALSNEPTVIPFDPEAVRQMEFSIDKMQDKIFILESPQQLYGCLDNFEQGCLI